jgi:hypothetical protein
MQTCIMRIQAQQCKLESVRTHAFSSLRMDVLHNLDHTVTSVKTPVREHWFQVLTATYTFIQLEAIRLVTTWQAQRSGSFARDCPAMLV